MSFSFSKKFPELLNESFLVCGLRVRPGTAEVVVCEVLHDASLAPLLVLAGVVLTALHRGRPLTVGRLPSVSLSESRGHCQLDIITKLVFVHIYHQITI